MTMSGEKVDLGARLSNVAILSDGSGDGETVREFVYRVLAQEMLTEGNTDIAIDFITRRIPKPARWLAGRVLDAIMPSVMLSAIRFILFRVETAPVPRDAESGGYGYGV